MSRIYQDTIMDPAAYAAMSNAPMVNIAHGAQNGPMTDFRNFVSNAAYVKQHLIPFLIEAPRGFQDLDRPDLYVAALKSLIEMQPQSIDGFAAGITVAVTETAVGGAGEMQQDPTNVTRARTEPSFVFKEKYGAPIQKFIETWICDLIMDPNSKMPRVIAAGVRPNDLLPDYYGCTVLFVEPDPSGTRVVRAWLCTNMFPLESGEVTGRRDITQDKQEQEYTIRFASMAQYSEGVDNFAQAMLNTLQMAGLSSATQQAFVTQVDADVAAANVGWASFLDEQAADRVVGPLI